MKLGLFVLYVICKCPLLSEFVHNAKRLVLYNQLAIEKAPFQTYRSALVFAPAMSIVKKQFKDRVPRWMRRPPEVEIIGMPFSNGKISWVVQCEFGEETVKLLRIGVLDLLN